ncbi:MAG TPA: hypothetical protein VHQ01_05655, partial [Pyrinomonadaceae bacterium]|nr:hypothetical protein [Pyrinomonadaceae bacterium]
RPILRDVVGLLEALDAGDELLGLRSGRLSSRHGQDVVAAISIFNQPGIIPPRSHLAASE